jgi:Carbohydrate family 9 binding domain-like
MNKKQILLLSLCFVSIGLIAQRSYLIQPIPIAPTIDGSLESESWSTIPITENFTTTLPSFGKTPQWATQVQMAYDERGVYIAAVCQSDKIRNEGSQRDHFGTGDYFSVGLDTWNDDQNAFEFAVNAAGQRIDIRQSSTLTEQLYDTYWQVQTKVSVDGWTLEMFIPYTALRFPKQTEQDWGLQFTRYDRSTGETSTWSPQDPLIKDKVLQYGQLEGLKQIRQRTRLGISVLNETNWDKRTFVVKDANIDFSNYSNMIVPAIDGRIGLGSASTLDFSILPDYNLDQSPGFFSGSPSLLQVLSVLPRQATQEESSIFNKSNILEPSFNISNITAGEILRKQPSDVIFPQEDFQLLQKSRFTTRTKNNIGIGISNSIFSRPEYGISDGFTSSYFEIVRLPYNPIYNNISIEKCFRNNSWIQISNGINFIDPSLWGNRAALSTQLRDKSNQFEVAGTLNVQSQGNYSVASGFIALGKVNGKITYGASYTAPKKTMYGLLILPPAVTPLPGSQMERFSAHLTQRNFSPSQKKWLNTTRSVQFIFDTNINNVEQDLPEFNLSWAGLDKKFQSVSWNFMFTPFRKTTFLDFEDIRLPQKQFFPIGFGGSFTTDARKKLVLPINFSNNWVLGSDRYNATLNFNPYWVLHRKWILTMEQFTRIETNQFISTTITGASTSRFAENRHIFSNNSKMSLRFIPSRRLYFDVGGQLLIYNQFNREIYELSSNGQINNTNYLITYNPRIDKTQSINASITWLVNAYSQLRIGMNNSAGDSFAGFGSTGTLNELPMQTTSNSFNLSFVWNIYRQ